MEKKRLIFGLMAALVVPGIVACGSSSQQANLCDSDDLNEKVAYDAVIKEANRNAAEVTYASFGENISPVLTKDGTNLKLQFQFTEDYFNQLVTPEQTSQNVTVYYGITVDGKEKTAQEIINANVAKQDFELSKGGLISLNFVNRNSAKYAYNLYQAVLVANIAGTDYCSSPVYGRYEGDKYLGVIDVDGTAETFKFEAKNMKIEGAAQVNNGSYPEFTNETTKFTQEFDLKNSGGYYKVSVVAADANNDEKDFVAYFNDPNRTDANPYIYAPITNIKTEGWDPVTAFPIFDYIYLSEGKNTFHLDGIDNGLEDKGICNFKEVIFEKVHSFDDAKVLDLTKKYNMYKAEEISQVYLESVQSTYLNELNGFKYTSSTGGFAQPITLSETSDMELTINYASQSNHGSLSLFIDGKDTNQDFAFANTGKWDNDFYNNVTIPLGTLEQGTHVIELRKNNEDSSINIYSLTFNKVNVLDAYDGNSLYISATTAPEVKQFPEGASDKELALSADGTCVEWINESNILTYQFYSKAEAKAYVNVEYSNGSGNAGSVTINGSTISLETTGGNGAWDDTTAFKESTNVEISLKQGINTFILSKMTNCNMKSINIKWTTPTTCEVDTARGELKYYFTDSVYDPTMANPDRDNLPAHVWGTKVGAKFTFYVSITDGDGARRFFLHASKNWEGGKKIRITVNDQTKDADVTAEWMIFESDADKMFFKNGLNTVTIELLSGENVEFSIFGVNKNV